MKLAVIYCTNLLTLVRILSKLSLSLMDFEGRSVLARGLEESIPFFRSAIGLVRRCIGNAAPSFLTTQLSLVVLATYMHSMRV